MVGNWIRRTQIVATKPLLGNWQNSSGEVWKINKDGLIDTKNAKWPKWSYEWEVFSWQIVPSRIRLYYGPDKELPKGVFFVSMGWNILYLTRRGTHEALTFQRVREPGQQTRTAALAIGAFVLGIGLVIEWRSKRKKLAASEL